MKMMNITLSIILFSTFVACGLKDNADNFKLESRERADGEIELRNYGGADGTIELQASGSTTPYTHQWRNEGKSKAVANADVSYTMVVTDQNGNSTSPAYEGSIITEKIIKRGTISMEVENYDGRLAMLKDLVKTSKGYIGNESETRSNYQVSNHVVIRVANSQFDQLMDNIADLAFELKEKHASLNDVTEEFYDIEARLKAKREVEQRYIDILQKADSVEDILKVERELKNIREEIEAKEGRLKYLENHVSFSTINVTLYENFDYDPPVAKSDGFIAKMGNALEGGWEGLLGLIIGITYLWPFLIAVAAIIFTISRLIKRRKAAHLANA